MEPNTYDADKEHRTENISDQVSYNIPPLEKQLVHKEYGERISDE
jgi:hypothetical protein